MKKIFLLTFSLILLLIEAKAQNTNQIDSHGRKQGKWEVKYDNSTVPKYIGQYKNGQPVGTFTYYYPSNKVKGILKFDANPNISHIVLFHENGEVMAKGKYINRLKDSIWMQFGPSGQLSYTESYKNGVLNGPKVVYYIQENGDNKLQKAEEYFYIDSVANGPVTQYFPDGVLKMKGNYVDGRLEGKVEYFNPNGTIERLCRYKNHLKHGWWIAYDMGGKETNRMYYWNNKELKGKELEAKMQELKAKGIDPNM
jgi:antitoxin component YwqK of YwqJK toxin-antitoxin module